MHGVYSSVKSNTGGPGLKNLSIVDWFWSCSLEEMFLKSFFPRPTDSSVLSFLRMRGQM